MSDTPRTPVNFGYRTGTIRVFNSSFVIPVRLVVITLALFSVAIGSAFLAIRFGDYPLTGGQVLSALLGQGDEFHQLIVRQWRLPGALAALIFGALLGVGGAIFQSLTRNPLGSPDVIGFDAGSYTAVVLTILLFGTASYWSLAAASLVGGLLTAGAVYFLAYRRGIQGFRLIIVGIGVSAILGSINAYLITRADLNGAMTVGHWGAGSISRVSWSTVLVTLVVAAVIAIGAWLLSPTLRRLELGDEIATTHGIRPNPGRLALVIVGVSTAALVTAAAGPIGFIALVSPQLARRLTRSAGAGLLPAAAMGAALLTGAHLLSLIISITYRPIPVGLLTVCLGGLYLIWLLIQESRRQFGAP